MPLLKRWGPTSEPIDPHHTTTERSNVTTEDELTLPSFLNRKVTRVNPLTSEERAEYLARFAGWSPEPKPSTLDERALEDIEAEEKARAKERAAQRIAKMLARKAEKDQTKGIPDEFLSWDAKRSSFYDVRLRSAKKLTAKRAELKLPPLDETETKKAVVRILGLKSWERK